MRLLLQSALIILFVATCFIVIQVALEFDRKTDTIVHLSERRTVADERCESSMHRYLDEIVKNKSGVLVATGTTPVDNKQYAPVLDASEYPR